MRPTLLCAALLVALGCSEQAMDLGTAVPVDPEYATHATIQGEAEGGAGAPMPMATHQFGASALAIDESRIYWVSVFNPLAGVYAKAVLRSCEKNDCASTLVSYPWNGFRQIVVDETRIYWVKWSEDYSPSSRNQGVVACPISGCIGSPETVAAMADEEFLVDAPAIYWLKDDKLWKCTMGDCERTLTFLALLEHHQTPNGALGRLTASSRDLYWLDGDATMGSIMTMPKDGSSPPRAVISGRPQPWSLTFSDNRFYWGERGFEIRSCPLADCAGEPTLVASSQSLILTLAADDRAAYWATMVDDLPDASDATPAQFMARPLGGGAAPRPLYVERSGLSQWALDATHLYWASPGPPTSSPSGTYWDGAIRRIRRPF